MAELNDGVKAALGIIVREAMSDGDPNDLLDAVASGIADAADGVDGLLKLADYLAQPDKLAAPGQFPGLSSILQEEHQTRVGDSYPATLIDAIEAAIGRAQELQLDHGVQGKAVLKAITDWGVAHPDEIEPERPEGQPYG